MTIYKSRGNDPVAIVCDGCGRQHGTTVSHKDYQAAMDDPEGEKLVKAALKDAGLSDQGALHLCDDCRKNRADDPVVYVRGRALLVSELERQAKEDPELAAALDGDTVQEAIKAAKRGD